MSVGSNRIEQSPTRVHTQGGYIQFGDKACNATFEVKSVSAEKIDLRVVSARHCRFENGLEIPKAHVHLYFDKSQERSAGYLKNIPVHEDVSARSTKLMKELEQLSLPADAVALFLAALKIPTHTEHDALVSLSTTEQSLLGMTPNFDLNTPEKLVCLNKDLIPDLATRARPETDVCWSALDVGYYDLQVNKNDVSAETFSFLSQKLLEKKNLAEDYLKKNVNMAQFANAQRQDFIAVQTELRFHNYASLAYLLNFDHCRIAQSENSTSASICRHQARLIDLVQEHLRETDATGRTISIFERLTRQSTHGVQSLSYADLKAGRRWAADRTPTTFAAARQLAESHRVGVYSDFRESVAGLLSRTNERVRRQSTDPNKDLLTRAFIVNSNLQMRDGLQQGKLSFTQFALTSVSRQPLQIQLALDPAEYAIGVQGIHGMTRNGALRMGVPLDDELVTFGESDSGSLVTYAGVVPLMVLNTINDKGVSGGASILALPQAESEDNVSADDVAKSGDGTDARKNKTAVTAACR